MRKNENDTPHILPVLNKLTELLFSIKKETLPELEGGKCVNEEVLSLLTGGL